MLSKLGIEYRSRFDVRLTAYYTSTLLFLIIAISFFFYFRLEHNLVKQVDEILLDGANELALEIKETGSVLGGVQGFAEDVGRRKHYPILFQVLATDGSVVWRPEAFSGFFTFGIQNKAHFSVYSNFAGDALEGNFRVFEQRIQVDGRDGPYVIHLATVLKKADKILANYLENIVSAVPIVFIASILCGMYIAKKPRDILKEIIGVTRSITSRNLSERLILPKGRDEIRELSLTINSMLDRIEGSFEQIKQFTGDVSHELRTPLAVIKGEIEVAVSHGKRTDDFREALYNCLERVDEIIKMVNDLILVAQFDEKKADLELKRIDMTQLMAEIVDFFMPLAQDKRIRLTMDTEEVGTLSADRGRILRLVNNLMENAMKFTPDGGAVHISIKRCKKEMELRVEDTGPGIPAKDLQNIFRRFYQVDPARSGSGRGAGLGLHICERIVELHGGSISAKNKPEGGAVFRVKLPIA